jgi:hypothetical protein
MGKVRPAVSHPPPPPRLRPPEIPRAAITQPGQLPGADLLREDVFQSITDNRQGPLMEDNEVTNLTAMGSATRPDERPRIPPAAVTEPGAPMFLDEPSGPVEPTKAPPRDATPEVARPPERARDVALEVTTPLDLPPGIDVSATQPPKPVAQKPKAALPAPVDRRRPKPQEAPVIKSVEAPVPLAPDALIPLEADEGDPPFEPTDAVKPVLPGRLVVAPLVGGDVDAAVRTQARDLPARMRTVRSRGQKLLVVDGLSDSQAELLIERLERVGIVADRRSKEDLGDAVELGRGLAVRTLALAALALVVVAAAAGVWAGFLRQREHAAVGKPEAASATQPDGAAKTYAGYEAEWWRASIRDLARRASAAPDEEKRQIDALRVDTERKARSLGVLP